MIMQRPPHPILGETTNYQPFKQIIKPLSQNYKERKISGRCLGGSTKGETDGQGWQAVMVGLVEPERLIDIIRATDNSLLAACGTRWPAEGVSKDLFGKVSRFFGGFELIKPDCLRPGAASDQMILR